MKAEMTQQAVPSADDRANSPRPVWALGRPVGIFKETTENADLWKTSHGKGSLFWIFPPPQDI